MMMHQVQLQYLQQDLALQPQVRRFESALRWCFAFLFWVLAGLADLASLACLAIGSLGGWFGRLGLGNHA